LAAAPDQEYRAILGGAIREAYREDFERIDPAQDTQAQMNDAFRPYQPRSQTARMVMLFLALCREAGISVLEAPRQRQMKGTVGNRPTTPRTTHRRRDPETHAAPNAPPYQAHTSIPFALPDEEIEVLTEEEFGRVWDALGLVARTRALARRRARAAEETSEDTEPEADTPQSAAEEVSQ
jgi:hypothetical protein